MPNKSVMLELLRVGKRYKFMDDKEISNYIHLMLEKSEEAYLMSIEIINKPTIKSSSRKL